MLRLESKVPIQSLVTLIDQLNFVSESGYIFMAQNQHTRKIQSEFIEAVEEIAKIRGLTILGTMVHKIPAGKRIPMHRDFINPTPLQPRKHPCVERWHLPILTNPDVYWWDEQHEWLSLEQGYWYGPVPYWINHKVENRSSEERVHLIVDLDTPNPVGQYVEECNFAA
jgi:hypothetical protein